MNRRQSLISVALVASLAAVLAGCGQTPTAPLTAADSRTDANSWSAQNVDLIQQVKSAMLGPIEQNGAIDQAAAKGTWLEDDFNQVDMNHDGKVTEQELNAYLNQQSVGPVASHLGLLGAIGIGLAAIGFPAYMAYAGVVGSNQLMYPQKDTFQATPDTYGATYTRVVFKSYDGLNLVGWYVPAAQPTDKGLVLFHGHGSDKDKMYQKYGQWLHQKYNLFLYDSRYDGESQGKYETLGYYETKDAVLAIDQLRQRGNHAIGLMGESMGGAVAIEAGAIVPDVKAVLSDCAFDSLKDAVAPRAALQHYPLPNAVGYSVVTVASIRAHADLPTADPIRWVAKIAPRPFFLIHGLADDETTPMNGQKLFAAAQEPKQQWWVPGAAHAGSITTDPTDYKAKTFAFFDQAL